MRAITISDVVTVKTGINVRMSNKRGCLFGSKAEVQADIAALEPTISDETLIALAINKVGGFDNASQLIGKTVTLVLDVTVA